MISKLLRAFILFFFKKAGAAVQNLQGFKVRLLSGPPNIDIVKAGITGAESVCIFAAFSKSAGLSLLSQIQEIYERGYTIIFVSNLPVDATFKSLILPYVSVIIQRPNYGRDFAAYKEGFQYVCSNCPNANSVIFTNDTFLLPVVSGDSFWEELSRNSADLYGAFLSFVPTSHVQSFFFRVNKNLFWSENYKKFWNGYKTFNSRFHTIKNGELMHSKIVINSGAKISAYIEPYSIINKIELDCSIDATQRAKLHKLISKAFETGNPSHNLALISINLFGIPLLKKDLLSSKSITISDVGILLNGKINEIKIREEFFNQMLLKGVSGQYGVVKRFMKRIEMI